MFVLRVSTALVLVAGLAACGSNPADRAITGGGIGAAAGAAGAAITGGSVLGGAALGGAAGAVAGALTDESEIDLGDPIYQ